jgi:lipopolysaccharide transport system ATP-binding protein
MNNLVIKVDNLWKEYRLGVIGYGTLTHDLQSRWARFRGREDPNLKIDFHQREIDLNQRFQALRGVSFDVRNGEILGIIGRNGAGKSTLLKIISRVTAPTSGSIRIKGKVASLLEVGTGFHPELTGRENIYLNGAILGMNRAEITDKFDAIMEFAEVQKFIDTPVKRYSSGMYVRLAFAVAAHLDPDILVVDEVLAVGDALFQEKCIGKMGEISREGRTVLFVSHNLTAVKALCTRAIVIEEGRIIFTGDVNDAVEFYLNHEKRLSDPSIPVAERKREKNCTLRAKIVDVTLWAEGEKNPRVVNPFKPLRVEFTVESGFDLRCSADIQITDDIQTVSLLDAGYIFGQDLFLRKGTNTIVCDIKSLNLYSGTYYLTCDICIHGQETIDCVNKACVIIVEECDPKNSGFNLQKGIYGFYYIDHAWSTKTG